MLSASSSFRAHPVPAGRRIILIRHAASKDVAGPLVADEWLDRVAGAAYETAMDPCGEVPCGVASLLLPARRMTRAPSSTPPRSGCLGVLSTALLSCLLLIPNGWLALTVIQSLRTVMPNLLESPKLVQVVVFVLPMLLLVIEWWLFDQVRDRWRVRRNQDAPTATRQP